MAHRFLGHLIGCKSFYGGSVNFPRLSRWRGKNEKPFFEITVFGQIPYFSHTQCINARLTVCRLWDSDDWFNTSWFSSVNFKTVFFRHAESDRFFNRWPSDPQNIAGETPSHGESNAVSLVGFGWAAQFDFLLVSEICNNGGFAILDRTVSLTVDPQVPKL